MTPPEESHILIPIWEILYNPQENIKNSKKSCSEKQKQKPQLI